MKTGEKYDDFILGLMAANGIGDCIEASNRWTSYAQQFNDVERKAIEAGGYQSGLIQGNEVRDLFPEMEDEL
jgi:hypothetical protein